MRTSTRSRRSPPWPRQSPRCPKTRSTSRSCPVLRRRRTPTASTAPRRPRSCSPPSSTTSRAPTSQPDRVTVDERLHFLLGVVVFLTSAGVVLRLDEVVLGWLPCVLIV